MTIEFGQFYYWNKGGDVVGTKKLYTIGEVSEITGINKRTNVYKMKDNEGDKVCLDVNNKLEKVEWELQGESKW